MSQPLIGITTRRKIPDPPPFHCIGEKLIGIEAERLTDMPGFTLGVQWHPWEPSATAGRGGLLERVMTNALSMAIFAPVRDARRARANYRNRHEHDTTVV